MTASTAQQPTALPIQAGQIIGERYLVGEVLGYGGMGVICAGTHVLLGTPVAIKLIHSELKDDPEAMQRFVNEARSAAALKGEHIARVFDVGVLPSGEPYLVMEQLEGTSLDQYLEGRGALEQHEAVDILLQVCEGLAEAHAAGLVHRDIKPSNLFLALRPDGRSSIKILDFGIVKSVHAESPRLTDPDKSLGSPWYMSPEQMTTPADVDARSDVWSLGVLLFELLSRRLPFEGDSLPEVCANVLASPPASLFEYRNDLAPELDAIVHHCLEKDRDRRISSVSELAHALLPHATVLHAAAYAVEESRVPAEARTVRPYALPRRRVWPLALAFVALPLLLAAGWLQYRDPSLAVHITRAVVGANARLSPDAAPLFEEPSGALQSPRLLQYLHTAQAWRERERSSDEPEPVSNEPVRAEPVKATPVRAEPAKAQRRPLHEPVAIPYPLLVPPEPAPPSAAPPPPSQASAPPPVSSTTEAPAPARDKSRETEERYGL
ncbi:MAG TPA: serine/threonine-protein kinase [Polyangiaceae bacterium]|nr:serine/threonine-protein kinase [Polyangiaceae bacterium]